MKASCSLFLFIACITIVNSQDWIHDIQDPNNFYDIRSAFLNSRKETTEDITEPKDDEDAKFKRWEYFIEPRVYPTGKLPKSNCLVEALDEYNKLHHANHIQSRSKKWVSLEPQEGFPFNGYTGRINCLAFHPTDTNIIYIGAPAGGLWKSLDGGLSWNVLTDQIPSIGVSEIVVNPIDPQIIYIATGDRDAANFISNPYSYGILKSIDGGLTWDTTGLQYMLTNQMSVARIIIHPKNPNILMAALKSDIANYKGIWRTEDGGKTWTNVSGGAKYDVEFHPTNPDIVYTSGYKNIQKSVDGGKTWNVINSSDLPPVSEITSSKIAVTPAAPDNVYVEYIALDGNTYGLYKSTDTGKSWTKINSLVLSTQGGYDFDIAVSSVDTNFIVTGGQNLYVSSNGGKDNTLRNAGHLDHHGFYFRPGTNSLYDCNDGGLYKSYNKVNSWINLNKGLNIYQYYRLGCSQMSEDFILTGAQDNGTLSHRLPNWQQVLGADGMECAIDPFDDQFYYISYQYGNFVGGGFASSIFRSPPGAGSTNYAWVAPFLIHPKNSQTLFAGGKDIYISKNKGANWINYSTDLTKNDPVGGGFLRGMAISESNPDQLMYAISYVVVYKTNDGGKNWKTVTSNLPTSAGCLDCSALSSILIHPENPDTVWVTMSGYSQHNKVYQSNDGGASWFNISGTLPAVPVNTIVYEKDNDDALYIGTDIGVFFRNNKSSDWEPFMEGMPRVPVQELEIVEPFHKIRAATFGRGLWEASLEDVHVNVKSVANSLNNMVLYPNPNNNHITIEMREVKEKMEIVFIDANGIEVFRHKLNNSTEEIELPKSASKILYYQIYSEAVKVQSGILHVN
jgi:photosystem II stability/assembly factor-like uncharacterized protein